MCEDKKNAAFCEHPDKLKGKPGECSPEQVAECHGKPAKTPKKEQK